MKRDEKCIVPDCDEATFSGAKPIYINVTIDGKRTWKKVGALCRVHLETDVEERSIMSWLVFTPANDTNFIYQLQKADLPLLRRVLERLEDELQRGFQHKTRIKKVAARIRALEKDLLKKDAERRGQEIVDQVLPRKKTKDVELSVADWREIHELGKKVLPGTENLEGPKVHCDACGCDNVPEYDNWDHPVCIACGARVKKAGEP